MIHVIEQYTKAKSTTAPSEDGVVVTAFYAAVIDGATAKSAFRYPGGMTPGQVAVQRLTAAIKELSPEVTAQEATRRLSSALHQEGVRPCDRPIASAIIYSAQRHEIWMLGDCQYATIHDDGTLRCFTNEKRIDHLLASWRRDIIQSYLSRGIMTEAEILARDPGRRIIQPHITRQVRYQNLASPHPLAYCMLDGEPIPEHFIRIDALDPSVKEIILASDGYPKLLPTLEETERRLQALLAEDPLCLGPLLGTKGIRPGAESYDDRSFLKLGVNNSSPTHQGITRRMYCEVL